MRLFLRRTIFSMTLLGWIVSCSAEVSNSGKSWTIESIKDGISKHGARKTIDLVYKDHNAWTSVLVNVASGQEDWVKVAIQLYQGSDGGSAEMLILALGEALERNPGTVLKNIASVIDIRNVCGSPDIDSDRYNSSVKAIAAIEQRKKMVEGVDDRNLISMKHECLVYLEKAKRSVSDFFDSEQ